ncbi:MAG: hypothetical protein QOJ36_1028, partial [Verrucomicrobiota bacterium]
RIHIQSAELGGVFFIGEAAAHCVPHRVRLLADFLEHVVRVIALLNVFGAELDFADFVLAGFSIDRADVEILAVECNQIEIIQVNDVAGMSDNRAHVAGEKVFVFADSENERTPPPRANNEVWDIAMNDSDAIRSDDLLERRPRGVDQARLGIVSSELAINAPDQVRQNFGVGVGAKIRVAVLDELLFERLIIFNYAVVDESDFASGVEVRMGVLIVDFSVRRPTSVTDSVGSGGRFLGNEFGQRSDATGAFAGLDVIAIDDGDAGRVVASILEATKPIEQNGRSLRASDVTDDSTHIGK